MDGGYQDEGHQDEEYYPAFAFPTRVMRDRHEGLQRLPREAPGGLGPPSEKVYRSHLAGMGQQVWMDRNPASSVHMDRDNWLLGNASAEQKPTRL